MMALSVIKIRLALLVDGDFKANRSTDREMREPYKIKRVGMVNPRKSGRVEECMYYV